MIVLSVSQGKTLRMIRPPTWDLVYIYTGVRSFRFLCMKLCVALAHVTVDIIYNTRLLKRGQHMTVTYVVVTLVAVLVVFEEQSFRLPDPNKDHNSYDLQCQSLLLPVTTTPKVLYDFVYATPQHALDEY